MIRNRYLDDYFSWMCKVVSGPLNPDGRPYRLLLGKLFNTPFVYILPMDGNRLSDGIDLRYRYARECRIPDTIIGTQIDIFPCSVLEMMIALCIRCEEQIMEDPDIGNRTSTWFWEMIESLDLSGMSDPNYNDIYVDVVLERFLSMEYEPNGKGGLFTIPDAERDLTKMEIWQQLMMHLNDISRR